jgi:UDP-GlcNAc:undecaprenyl-phosphate GlcNAc-1-phosphate transferase
VSNFQLYLSAIAISGLISAVLTPLVRVFVLWMGWVDRPSGIIKTHRKATPAMGGLAIGTAYVVTLIVIRTMTQFPSGTLRSLRAILAGGTAVLILGFLDDFRKPRGLGFKSKFIVQIAAASLLMLFDIRIHFIHPQYIGTLLTVLWVVGITNAFNLVDIMDGLCASQAAVAALAFLCIALPYEEIYVSFASAALLGAVLGFLPWNFSEKRKIFMGDTGSLFLGFVLSAISMGTHYSQVNPLGVYAPLFILMVPMYDTFFVMAVRMIKGRSPFMGSPDHFALRLERIGLSRGQIVALATLIAGLLSLCAFLVTQVGTAWALLIYGIACAYIAFLSWELHRIEVP